MTPARTKGRSGGANKTSTVASEFGDRLRMARQAKGLTLRQVSEAGGISVTYLSDLERGALRNPTLDTLTGIARALGVSINDLLGVSDPAETDGSAQLPEALAEFLRLPQFKEAVDQEASARKLPREALEREWLRCLEGVSIAGRRPKQAYDYLFVWEAIRRVLG
jgi:transcriptional regulator with XRE-family HTH domain